MSIGRSIVLLGVALILSAYPLSADQTFRISTGISHIPTSLRAIQDFESGNILALITQLDVGDKKFGRVHGVLIRNQPQTQNYAVGNPRLISQDSGWQGRANGVYNPATNRYLIVWDNGGTETPTGASSIFARQASATGKPKGSVQEIIANGDFNSFPVMISNATPQFGNGTGGVVNILIWSGQRVPGDDDRDTHGLNASPVNITKKNVRVDQSKHKLIESNKSTGIGPFPERGKGYRRNAATPAAENFGVAINGFRYVIEGGYRQQGFSYALDVNPETLEMTVEQRIDLPLDTLTPSALGVAKGAAPWNNQYMLALNTKTSRVIQMLFKNGLLDNNQELLVLNASVSHGVALLPENHYGNYGMPTAKQVFGHVVVAANSGWIISQKVGADGSLLGKPVKLFAHNGTLVTMQVYRIDREGGMYNTLILWQKQLTDTQHEAWAYFTNLK